MVGVTNTRVAKTIINNTKLINAKQMAEKIGLLKKDMKQVDAENLLNALPLVQEDGELTPILPPKEYLYFTIPVTKVKKDMYRMLFNRNIKDNPLNQRSRAKVTPIFEEALTSLGIEAIWVPSYVLKQNNTSSIFKAEINSPAFNLILEKERLRKPNGETSFYSEIGDKLFCNTYSRNEEHPRVFNMFTKMSSVMRKHVFENVYGVNMVEVDLTNSVIQCLASRGKCTGILEAIRTNTLLPVDQDQRGELKENLLKWIFTIISPRENMKGVKTYRKNKLKEFLSEKYLVEVIPFMEAIETLESSHTLFHYEDILREFCKQNRKCISLHDAVYISADRTDLIEKLTVLLDSQNYYYKVNPL